MPHVNLYIPIHYTSARKTHRQPVYGYSQRLIKSAIRTNDGDDDDVYGDDDDDDNNEGTHAMSNYKNTPLPQHIPIY